MAGVPSPAYPPNEVIAGHEGQTTVSVHVLPDGSIRAVEVAQSSGFPILDDAAVVAVRGAKWIPAKDRNGQPIESTVRFPIVFKLTDDTSNSGHSTECSKEEMVAWIKANGAAIRHQVRYPLSARANKQERRAIVSLSVNTDGTVRQSSIKLSTGLLVLDAEARNIMKGKYSAPVCGGKNVSMNVDVPVIFSAE